MDEFQNGCMLRISCEDLIDRGSAHSHKTNIKCLPIPPTHFLVVTISEFFFNHCTYAPPDKSYKKLNK